MHFASALENIDKFAMERVLRCLLFTPSETLYFEELCTFCSASVFLYLGKMGVKVGVFCKREKTLKLFNTKLYLSIHPEAYLVNSHCNYYTENL